MTLQEQQLFAAVRSHPYGTSPENRPLLLARLSPYADDVAGSLIRLLDEADDYAMVRIVAALGTIGDRRAVEPLLARLHEQSATKFAIFACVLGMLSDARAVDPLLDVLNDVDGYIQQDMDRRLPDPSKPLHRLVHKLVGRLFLRKMLRDSAESSRILYCASAAGALARLGDLRAIEPLHKCCNDPDERVRSTAQTAIDRLQAA